MRRTRSIVANPGQPRRLQASAATHRPRPFTRRIRWRAPRHHPCAEIRSATLAGSSTRLSDAGYKAPTSSKEPTRPFRCLCTVPGADDEASIRRPTWRAAWDSRCSTRCGVLVPHTCKRVWRRTGAARTSGARSSWRGRRAPPSSRAERSCWWTTSGRRRDTRGLCTRTRPGRAGELRAITTARVTLRLRR